MRKDGAENHCGPCRTNVALMSLNVALMSLNVALMSRKCRTTVDDCTDTATARSKCFPR